MTNLQNKIIDIVVGVIAVVVVLLTIVAVRSEIENSVQLVTVDVEQQVDCIRLRTGAFTNGTFQIKNCEGELITWEK